nr:MAG TPA: hypothetical protein [Caudoviricetes sp.]
MPKCDLRYSHRGHSPKDNIPHRGNAVKAGKEQS